MQCIKVFAQSCGRVCVPGGNSELHAMLKALPVQGLHHPRTGTPQPKGHDEGSRDGQPGFLKVRSPLTYGDG